MYQIMTMIRMSTWTYPGQMVFVFSTLLALCAASVPHDGDAELSDDYEDYSILSHQNGEIPMGVYEWDIVGETFEKCFDSFWIQPEATGSFSSGTVEEDGMDVEYNPIDELSPPLPIMKPQPRRSQRPLIIRIRKFQEPVGPTMDSSSDSAESAQKVSTPAANSHSDQVIKEIATQLGLVLVKYELRDYVRSKYLRGVIRAACRLVYYYCTSFHPLSALARTKPDPIFLNPHHDGTDYTLYLAKFIEYLRPALPNLTIHDFVARFNPLLDALLKSKSGEFYKQVDIISKCNTRID